MAAIKTPRLAGWRETVRIAVASVVGPGMSGITSGTTNGSLYLDSPHTLSASTRAVFTGRGSCLAMFSTRESVRLAKKIAENTSGSWAHL